MPQPHSFLSIPSFFLMEVHGNKNTYTYLPTLDTVLPYFFFYILSNRPWKSFNIIDRELSCSLFPSLTPSFFLTAHSIVWLPRSYLVRNLGCFLTFVFTTSATVNYLVHMSFLCHRYNFRVNSQ